MNKRCSICNETCEDLFCGRCLRELPRVRYPFSIPFIDSLQVMALYEDPLKSLMHDVKFKGHLSKAKVFSSLFRLRWKDERVDGVFYIPSHWTREFLRGCNPGKVLAKEVGKVLGVPTYSILKRRRLDVPSHTLPGWKRKVKHHRFQVKKKPPVKRLLLVDDIMTTGKTLQDAAMAVKFAMPEVEISAVVFLGKGRKEEGFGRV
ncbi:MAG: phosphoribosyltransferase family protein [Tissierellia bacterium]|nr:phosphoribosyltransferase family protein [Tissierellia bacterium]